MCFFKQVPSCTSSLTYLGELTPQLSPIGRVVLVCMYPCKPLNNEFLILRCKTYKDNLEKPVLEGW